MTLFQLLMLGASAFFAYKIYKHIGTLKDPQENFDDASNKPRSADAFSTFDATSLIEKADEEREEGNLDKALAIYSEANIKTPNSAETLFKMGYTLALQERDDEALEYYKESLELDKENPFIHQAMATSYRKLEEFASSRMHLNAALAQDATNPTTYFNYGNLLVDMKLFDEAKEMYKKAMELDANFTQAKEELAALERV